MHFLASVGIRKSILRLHPPDVGILCGYLRRCFSVWILLHMCVFIEYIYIYRFGLKP